MDLDQNENADEIERLEEVVSTNTECVETTNGFIFELGGENGRIAK